MLHVHTNRLNMYTYTMDFPSLTHISSTH